MSHSRRENLSTVHREMKASLICKLIDVLNDTGCINAIRVLQQMGGCQNLNGFLTKMTMQMTETMSFESIQQLKSCIQQITTDMNQTKHKQGSITT